jgi:hypothetical protein
MTTRRDPGLAGVVGITADDLANLEAGRITMLDLASKLGVSKQAVSRRVSRMRSTSSTDASTPPSATAAPTSSTSPTVTPLPAGASIPAESIAVDPAEVAVSACLGLLMRSHILLAGGDQIGPSGLKALAATISTATAELRQLGIMSAADDEDTALSTLSIRVMTDAEHDEIKHRVELPDDHQD